MNLPAADVRPSRPVDHITEILDDHELNVRQLGRALQYRGFTDTEQCAYAQAKQVLNHTQTVSGAIGDLLRVGRFFTSLHTLIQLVADGLEEAHGEQEAHRFLAVWGFENHADTASIYHAARESDALNYDNEHISAVSVNEVTRDEKPATLLEWGSGLGNDMLHIADNVRCRSGVVTEYLGIDTDNIAVDAARGRADQRGLSPCVKFERADVRSKAVELVRAKCTFDRILSSSSLHIFTPNEIYCLLCQSRALQASGGSTHVYMKSEFPDVKGAHEASNDDPLVLLEQTEAYTVALCRDGLRRVIFRSDDAIAEFVGSAGYDEVHVKQVERKYDHGKPRQFHVVTAM